MQPTALPTKHHHFSSLSGKWLWWSQHISILLHLPCVLRVPISVQSLLKTWQAKARWAQGAFSPSFQKWTWREQTSKDAVIYLCEQKIKSSIFSLCYYFSVSITWLSWQCMKHHLVSVYYPLAWWDHLFCFSVPSFLKTSKSKLDTLSILLGNLDILLKKSRLLAFMFNHNWRKGAF